MDSKKTVIILGSSSGIGSKIIKYFSKKAQVYLTYGKNKPVNFKRFNTIKLDLNNFKSLEKMFIRNDKFYIPTHGSIIKNPKNFVKALIGHRKMRESQIKKYLEKEEKVSISDLVAKMYPKLDKKRSKKKGNWS